MTGWSGGAANYTWKRDDRRDGATTEQTLADVRAILAKFRQEHGWQPGMIWDAYQGTYRRDYAE